MKIIVIACALLSSLNAVAAETPALGNFQGLAYSSATSRHPIDVRGGSLSACEASGGSLTKCKVAGGSLQVAGSAENVLRVEFQTVSFLQAAESDGSRHYYYKGQAQMASGLKVATIPVRVTLSVGDEAPDRVFGVIELPDQNAKTTLEAYRVP